MRRLRSGFLTIGRVLGAAVRLHWSLPLGAVLFTGLRVAPGAWLGFLVLVLVHELGHAVAASRSGLRVTTVDAHALGGVCRWEGYPTPKQRAFVAWAGVIAQAALGLSTLALLGAVGWPAGAFGVDLVHALLWTNLWLIGLNLLPIPPFDGAEAWSIVVILLRSRALRREDAERARTSTETRAEVHRLEAPDDALPPMPEEVRRVLERVMAEGRAEREGSAGARGVASKKGK
jgi:stage IV sporulation protein FB